jgi:hypothetical protein
MGRGIGIVQLHRPTGMLRSFFHFVGGSDGKSSNGFLNRGVSEVGMRQREIRINFDRPPEQAFGLFIIRFPGLPNLRQALLKEIPSIEAFGRLPPCARLFRTVKLGLHGAHDRQRDFILYREDIFQVSIVFLGPKVRPCRAVDKLSGNTDAASRLAHAAFQYVAHPISLATACTSTAWPLYVKLVLRAITKN